MDYFFLLEAFIPPGIDFLALLILRASPLLQQLVALAI
jgi:hypothetical protein